MNFGSMHYLMGIKSIEKQFNSAAKCRDSIRPTACGARVKPVRMRQHSCLLHRCHVLGAVPTRRTNLGQRGGASARLPWGRWRGHEGGERGALGKVGNGTAHRGGRALVGWRGETGMTAFSSANCLAAIL
jgi:hypothetical protein